MEGKGKGKGEGLDGVLHAWLSSLALILQLYRLMYRSGVMWCGVARCINYSDINRLGAWIAGSATLCFVRHSTQELLGTGTSTSTS
jgi:hypothetical protein